MAKKENADIKIDGSTATWDLNSEGLIQGTYRGTFKFKCYLTPTEQIAVNREYRELLGSNITLAPDHESSLAYALTQLKYRVISAPPFFNSTLRDTNGYAGDIPDENVLALILDAAIRSEIKYKMTLKERSEKAIKSSRSKAEKIKSEIEKTVDENELEMDEEDEI